MAESRFLKTVTFGGYDKGDVDKRLEFLYSQVYDLKNELRETKLMLNKLKEGTSEEAAHESVLANERAKLTEMQVKNEAMSEKLKSAEEDNKKKEAELAELRAAKEELDAALADANVKLTAASGGGDAAMFGVVFAEAQKSATMIVTTAKQQAADLEADSKKLAENTVIEANNKASKIIYDAEVRAAKIMTDVKNDSSAMEAATGNMKASMLNEVGKIGVEISKLKNMLVEFQQTGIAMLDDSQKLIDDTKAELTAGGVPVFRNPELQDPALPDAPEYTATDNTYVTGADAQAQKKNEELEKLKEMANSIGSKPKADSAPAGGADLAAIAKQAAALKDDKKADEAPKKGGTDLSDLLKQAKSIK
ncbi:MAG: plectin [Ruminococcus sp.]|nr:plectin [Ruminococcus sp.]